MTDHTNASIGEARADCYVYDAKATAFRLVGGEKVGAGDGNTFVPRVPSTQQLCDALTAAFEAGRRATTPTPPTNITPVDAPTIPAGMVPWGPHHPEYPSQPSDWDGEPVLIRIGANGYLLRETTCPLDWSRPDLIAYGSRSLSGGSQ